MILAFTNQTSDLGNARVRQLVDEVTNDVVLFLIGLESGAKFLRANQKESFSCCSADYQFKHQQSYFLSM